MRVLVTGASGFIGAHLCRALLSRGVSVVAVVHGTRPVVLPGAELHDVDLRDAAKVSELVRQAVPTHVVHLAASKFGGALADLGPSYEANLLSTLNLAEAVIDTHRCRRFVFMGSAEEYGRAPVPFNAGDREAPTTAYGLSKLAATQLLQALAVNYEFPLIVLRATVVYGPGQQSGMFVPELVRSLLAGERFPMTAGHQTRDFVYVSDVVDGIIRALLVTSRLNGALHLSAGTPIAIRDVALLAARIIGEAAEALIDFGTVPLREGEALEYWADNSKTFAMLGWSPLVTLEEGLHRTIAYHRTSAVKR